MQLDNDSTRRCMVSKLGMTKELIYQQVLFHDKLIAEFVYDGHARVENICSYSIGYITAQMYECSIRHSIYLRIKDLEVRKYV
jgi:hypothetical protein